MRLEKVFRDLDIKLKKSCSNQPKPTAGKPV